MSMGITVTTEQILWLCGLISALWGVWKIVKELKKPNENLRLTVDKHEKLLNSDDKRLRSIEDSNKMILQSLLVIINHDITGNGIEKMKEAREELQEFLINKD